MLQSSPSSRLWHKHVIVNVWCVKERARAAQARHNLDAYPLRRIRAQALHSKTRVGAKPEIIHQIVHSTLVQSAQLQITRYQHHQDSTLPSPHGRQLTTTAAATVAKPLNLPSSTPSTALIHSALAFRRCVFQIFGRKTQVSAEAL